MYICVIIYSALIMAITDGYQCDISQLPERMFLNGTGHHTWMQAAASKFNIRSETYLHNSMKHPSGSSLFTLIDTDIVLHDDPRKAKFDHLSVRSDSYASYLRNHCDDDRRLLVIVFQMHPRYLILTFIEEESADDNASNLVNSLFSTDQWTDVQCAERLKIIPNLGSFHIPLMDINQPVVISKRLTTTFYRSAQLVEIDIDVFSSRIAKMILSSVIKAASTLEIDLGFLLQGNTDQELPERIIGAVHLSHIDISIQSTRTSSWE